MLLLIEKSVVLISFLLYSVVINKALQSVFILSVVMLNVMALSQCNEAINNIKS
jgi:hypothetical protein